MENIKKIKNLIIFLIVVFILIFSIFIIPTPSYLEKIYFPIVAILGFIFLILGLMLILFARKEKGEEKRKLRLFLIITGISAMSPLIFSVLHNLFYAMAITFENFRYLLDLLQATFFIISVMASPIVFIIGIITSIILIRKYRM